MLLHNVLICGLLLLGLLSLAEARRVCKDHSRHCRQLGDKRPRFHCYRKSTQERCCATCRNFENPNNQECLYGDKLAWCSSIGARYSAVSCYTHEVECCDACSKLSSDKIKDCPYGDREIWCPYFTKDRCKDQASRSSCCETCHHLLHGDTTNTHGNKVVTETSTSTPTDATWSNNRAGGDQNSTSVPPVVAVNTSHPVGPTEPNAASRATSVSVLKVTENHTDVTGLMAKHRDNVGGDVTITMMRTSTTSGLPTTTESVTTKPSPSTLSPGPAEKETPRPTGAAGSLGNSSRETSSTTVLSTSAASSSKDKGGSTKIPRALPVDNNTRDVTSSSPSPTVTYKPGAGLSSRTASLTSSSTSPSSSAPSSSSPSPSPSSSSSRGGPTTSPPVVTELRIRLQETPSPSPGGNDTRSHSSYLPSLEDDEDYALQASGDNDITIDDFTEERPTHEGGGHHHDGDHGGHHNGNHHGGHHHKKGHHKNGVTAEVPYRYIPAEREDYMFEDYKSSSCRIAARWWAILAPGLLVLWSITGETWRKWVT